MDRYEIVIIGAGVAGISAARSACEAGCGSVLLIDSKKQPGGILLQCAHRGFGPQMTGSEYVDRLMEGFPENIHFLPETTVLSVAPERILTVSGPAVGYKKIGFDQLILASGCMEISMGALGIGGTRPEGIYTAGEAQAMVNLEHRFPEEPVVILGSGDLGLIMAGHLMEHGVQVAALVEQKPHCGGLTRNQKCLKEYDIPLICSSTVTEVVGCDHLNGVKVRNLDTGEERMIPCSSLLIAAGLRPDRALVERIGNVDWLHLCGNCRAVHPMVEAVIEEGRSVGIKTVRDILVK